MTWISIFVLAFAVSLDSFGVGLTYGLRKITITIFPLIVISLLSACVILLATQLGSGLLYIIPEFWAQALGGFILIVIGIWAIYNLLTQKDKVPITEESKNNNLREQGHEQGPNLIIIEVKRLGILIQILRTPSKADIDRSGAISIAEAAVLGLALSLDAFGAGIGAALVGYPPFLTALLIGVCSFACLYSGVFLGKTFSDVKIFQKVSYLPGMLLIVLGLTKIFY
ncbi:sporulation membrane protein YtaF [Desulfuribacillus stibiiarsenatis]|uniref:Sporulation membrane protein YtaF n=1 Tax=Desulfuribacillus stibiiarsenatis TaxID=1390249 RepID=A0A1E5L2Z9_9FIRM|nr:sporulation membrane protein YtaF [Desulfuribacillus stibiiarsenatis]OEH84451.1 sporulation membrane protein YtaF [Desulfuribacillus stibiiarsenatis]